MQQEADGSDDFRAKLGLFLYIMVIYLFIFAKDRLWFIEKFIEKI